MWIVQKHRLVVSNVRINLVSICCGQHVAVCSNFRLLTPNSGLPFSHNIYWPGNSLFLSFHAGQPTDDSNLDGVVLCNGTNDGDNESMTDASDIDFSSSHLSLATVSASGNDQQTTTATTAAPQHSNIILIRGARTENGQIILQNSQELLNLLNGTGTVSISCEDEKLVQMPHSGFKMTTTTTTAKPTNGIGTGHSIFVQSPMRSNTSTSHQIVDIKTASTGGQTIVRLPPSNNVPAPTKKTNQTANAIPEGSIFLQQRLNKNGATDVPILLQTLKRLDKSQSILLFRNAQSSSSTLTTSTATMKTTSATAANHITVLNNANAKENTSTSSSNVGSGSGSGSASTNKTVSSNVPLGTGKFKFNFVFLYFYGLLWTKLFNLQMKIALISRFEC